MLLAFNRFTNKNGGQTVSAPAASMTLSKVLGVPVAFFFEDIADTSTPTAAPLASGEHNDPLGRREAAEFSLHTAPYQTPVVRRRLRQLAKPLSEGSNGSSTTAARSQRGRPSRRVRTYRGRGAAER
jgi:hypothetical protein